LPAGSRFLIDRDVDGDILELLVALSSCPVGYGGTGLRLVKTRRRSGTANRTGPVSTWRGTRWRRSTG